MNAQFKSNVRSAKELEMCLHPHTKLETLSYEYPNGEGWYQVLSEVCLVCGEKLNVGGKYGN